MIFPGTLSIGVTEAVTPTVAKAEKTSNNKSINGRCSLIDNKNKPKVAIKKLTIAIVKERFTIVSEMERPITLIESLPFTSERIYKIKIAKVTVLIPPAVDA